jgi:hypothetical protein
MIEYLLGLLTEERKVWFERQYFFDDSVFDRLLIVEQALIDRYAQKKLSEKETDAFEHCFLLCKERRLRIGHALVRRSRLHCS